MIYWFTGQPGHGKTLHAIDKALDYVKEGRLTYVCNVRGFLHEKAGCIPMTPEQFCDWPNFLPDGAVCLVDEAYEHGMLPKRGPGSKVPHHVEQLAKHRHRGLDFIFVSQSPARQVDDFVHDLIEQHVHVRRRFGLKFAHLRIFDKFERNPDKTPPLILKRVALPKRPMGLYESTKLDTTEKRVPWYYPAAALLLAFVIVTSVLAVNRVKNTLSGEDAETAEGAVATDGAGATAGAAARHQGENAKHDAKFAGVDDYIRQHTPRIAGLPWSAPVFDDRQVQSDPEAFCTYSGAGDDAQGEYQEESCVCLTEQGTRYQMEFRTCKDVAIYGGAYNPYKARERDARQSRGAGGTPAEKGAQAPAVAVASGTSTVPVTAYGGMRGPGDGPAHW